MRPGEGGGRWRELESVKIKSIIKKHFSYHRSSTSPPLPPQKKEAKIKKQILKILQWSRNHFTGLCFSPPSFLLCLPSFLSSSHLSPSPFEKRFGNRSFRRAFTGYEKWFFFSLNFFTKSNYWKEERKFNYRFRFTPPPPFFFFPRGFPLRKGGNVRFKN